MKEIARENIRRLLRIYLSPKISQSSRALAGHQISKIFGKPAPAVTFDEVRSHANAIGS